MKVFGLIYKLTNLINGKIYIGQTTKTLKQRFNTHVSESKKEKSTMIVSKAIKKYGKENFKIEEIAKAYSREELNTLEGKYIEEFKSHTEIGYNICQITNNQVCRSKETIAKFKAYRNLPENLEKACEWGRAMRGTKRNSTSKYMGVKKSHNKWIARISLNAKLTYIGTYIEEIDAAKARDIEELKYSGEKAKLNFEELRQDYLDGKIKPERFIYKKSSSKIVGVYFCTTHNTWNFSLKGFKVKRFTTQIEAEKYANLIVNSSKEDQENLDKRNVKGNIEGVFYSNHLKRWVAKIRKPKEKQRSFKTKEEAENQIIEWKK
jgi:group I intron endonuclease